MMVLFAVLTAIACGGAAEECESASDCGYPSSTLADLERDQLRVPACVDGECVATTPEEAEASE